LQAGGDPLLLGAFQPSRSARPEPAGEKAGSVFPGRLLLLSLGVTGAAIAWLSLIAFGPATGLRGVSGVVTPGMLLLLAGSWAVTGRSLYQFDHAARGLAGVVEERDRLVREHELMSTILNHLPDQIYAKDVEGRFVLNNMAHAKSLGLASVDEMRGKTDFDFFPEHLATQFFGDEQALIHSGCPLLNQEQLIPVYGNPKNHYWGLASKVLWRDRQGKIIGTAGITRDINESKLAEERLRRSEDLLRDSTLQLERSNRELQDFAYVASHDLQEPLRKIVVFAERLKEKFAAELSEEPRDFIDRMEKAAKRMQALINDLLAFSRVTARVPHLAMVDLARTAAEVVCDLEAQIESCGGRVVLGALPVIRAEPSHMRQLLQNLISNAIKFRKPGEAPLVRVEARRISTPPAPERWELTVSDNGIGFDEKYLDRIFNVFQRLHPRTEYEGSGMGLAIARKIVLFQGGEITAKSTPGCGSTFLVTLPATHRPEGGAS
jgi:PAS domain S-box-containing protein